MATVRSKNITFPAAKIGLRESSESPLDLSLAVEYKLTEGKSIEHNLLSCTPANHESKRSIDFSSSSSWECLYILPQAQSCMSPSSIFSDESAEIFFRSVMGCGLCAALVKTSTYPKIVNMGWTTLAPRLRFWKTRSVTSRNELIVE